MARMRIVAKARYRRTVIDRPAMSRLFVRGGDVYDWVDDRVEGIARRARIGAPGRSGYLSRMHRHSTARRSTYRVRGRVANNADYALFPHEGTNGPIKSNRGKMLGRMAPGPKGAVPFAKQVSGQAANPWLVRAARKELARYQIRL